MLFLIWLTFSGKEAETLVWNTPEGIPIKPLYTPADRECDAGKDAEVELLPLADLTTRILFAVLF